MAKFTVTYFMDDPFVIYEAVGYIGSLKITFGWLFSGGNIVSLGARKKVSFFPSSVEKNYHGK